MAELTELAVEWIDAGEYQFLLDGEEILARNAKGKQLKTVPAKARKLPEFEQLDALRTALSQHRQTCITTVSTWFLSGQTIPTRVIAAVWPDPAWQAMLKDAILNFDGSIGLLRDTTADSLSLVDIDGETVSVPVDDNSVVSLPHPILMDDLSDWREFAVELGVHQGFDQLFRDTYPKPVDEAGQREALEKYSGGEYEKTNVLVGRSRGGGFTVDFEEGVAGISLDVVEPGVENNAEITATLEVMDTYEGSAALGNLYFTRDGRTVPAEEVGPVAWSEGVRMAEFVFSGRTIKENTEDQP